ncbi:MAG TPA: hypothetical protein VHC22_14820 [Pirellulales bacterium]|nr:hypothetical protein [Pirellulales bacterium]
MTRRFPFSHGRLLGLAAIICLVLGVFSDFCGEITTILLLIVGSALAGASLGALFGHPWVAGFAGAAVLLLALFVIKVFNC